MVADEPLVGLDRDRAVGVVAAVEQRRAQPLLVAAVGDLADELVDEVAAVGEDQDAAGAGGVDEPDRGDGLAGAGRVLEPEAARGAGVLGRLGDLLLLLALRLVPVLGLLVGGELLVLLLAVVIDLERLLVGLERLLVDDGRSGAVAAAAVEGDLLLGDQLGQGPGERVDLVGVELGAVAQFRRLLGQQALEAEQQREVPPPLDRGVLEPLVELGDRGVERLAAGRPRGERLRPLAVEEERLAGELGRPLDVGG